MTITGQGPEASRPGRVPEVGLADLVRVAHALQPDPAVLEVAAELLGLARVPQPAPSAAPRTALADGLAETAHKPPAERPNEPGAPPQDAQAVPVSADYRPPRIQPQPEEAGGNLADLLPEGAPPKRHPGLLPPGHARALLTHLGGRLRPDGDFDAVRAVQLLAHGEPLFSLPRLWVETTRGGTELALDIGPGMQPFRSRPRPPPGPVESGGGAAKPRDALVRGLPGRRKRGVRDREARTGAVPAATSGHPDRGGDHLRCARWGASDAVCHAEVAAFRRRGQPGQDSAHRADPVARGAPATRAATPARRGHLGPERERAGRERCRPVRTARPAGPGSGRTLAVNTASAAESAQAEQALIVVKDHWPWAARLARLVSLAVRVEPSLLRAARLAAGLDAVAEADLWFSGIVASRSTLGISLAPSVAEALRAELTGAPADRDLAWQLLEDHHGREPWSIRLEERVNYLTTQSPVDVDAITKLLRAALTELHEVRQRDERAALGIARWLLAALARAPAAARATPLAATAEVAAGVHLDGRLAGPADLAGAESSRLLPWLLDHLGSVVVPVRPLPSGVALGGDPAEGIRCRSRAPTRW